MYGVVELDDVARWSSKARGEWKDNSETYLLSSHHSLDCYIVTLSIVLNFLCNTGFREE